MTDLYSYSPPDCPICFEILTEKLATATCGHVFHSICLRQCIYDNGYCPMCRNKDKTVILLSFEIKPLVSSMLKERCKDNTLFGSVDEIIETKELNDKLKKDNASLKDQLSKKIKDCKDLNEKIGKLEIDLHDLRLKLTKTKYEFGEEKTKFDEMTQKSIKNEELIDKLQEENKMFKQKTLSIDSFFSSIKYFDNFEQKYESFKQEVKEIYKSKNSLDLLTSNLYTLYTTIDELREHVKLLKKDSKAIVNIDESNNIPFTKRTLNSIVIKNKEDIESFFQARDNKKIKNPLILDNLINKEVNTKETSNEIERPKDNKTNKLFNLLANLNRSGKLD